MQIDPSIEKLTPALDRSTDSNNWKLVRLLLKTQLDQEADMVQLSDMHDIDFATGKFLDHLGRLVGEYRGQMDDKFYRSMIKSRIARQHSNGTINELYGIIAVTLGAAPSEFKVQPMWNLTGEARAVQVLGIPNKYVDSLQKREMVLERINDSVAADVHVIGIGFQVEGSTAVYIGTTVTRARKHVGVMDYRLPRDHDGAVINTASTAINRQRMHVGVVKEG
ncbi:hypothetical protein ACFP1L_11895 [Lactiplantibacillus nangangensis]|uniref:DUF2612 domain-containing protein n=1 Tax=Lactiplantibacillus nangangensis TaxID=2559917 RepID=A0ABW1SLG1_9LACO|nr:hypothetical protein [Lactiplantibacillus nangangensis]